MCNAYEICNWFGWQAYIGAALAPDEVFCVTYTSRATTTVIIIIVSVIVISCVVVVLAVIVVYERHRRRRRQLTGVVVAAADTGLYSRHIWRSSATPSRDVFSFRRRQLGIRCVRSLCFRRHNVGCGVVVSLSGFVEFLSSFTGVKPELPFLRCDDFWLSCSSLSDISDVR